MLGSSGKRAFRASMSRISGTARSKQLRRRLVPAPEVLRDRKTALPEPGTARLCLHPRRREPSFGVGFEFYGPALSHEPLVQCRCVAVDLADTDASFRVDRVRAFVLAVDCTTGKESLQSIARLDPASRNGAFFVEAELISLRGIDAIQTKCGPSTAIVTSSLTVTSPAQLGPTAKRASPRIHSRMSSFHHQEAAT